jgi:hypothetical protein
MSALSVLNPTLLDLAKLTDPNGQPAMVVEILNQHSPMLMHMSFQQGNLPTGHRHTIRTGLPEPTWRKLYGGVMPSKSTTAQVTDNCGMLEAYAEVDAALLGMAANPAAFRLSEDRAHIEGMGQAMQRTIIYGNEGSQPEAFTGLAPRYNSLSAANSYNIIDGGGTGDDNASIYLIIWGDSTCFGIVPRGSTAGIKVTDKGIVTVEDVSNGSNAGRAEMARTHYRWDAGLSLRNWQGVVRICNIDRSALSATIATGADLSDLMFEATERLMEVPGGHRVGWYMDRSILTMLRKQVSHKTKESTLDWTDVGGKKIQAFQDFPIFRTDAMKVDEARVV